MNCVISRLIVLYYLTASVLSYTYSYNNGGGNNNGGNNNNKVNRPNNYYKKPTTTDSPDDSDYYIPDGNNNGNGNDNGNNNGPIYNSEDFIKLIDVSDSALNSAVHGGSYLTAPGIAVFDCNNDGFEDILYASQENEYHKFFINNGDFTFSEEGIKRGLTTNYGSYGVISFDFDNNGDIDLVFSYVGDFDNKGLQFFYNIGNCQFEDRTSTILDSIPELWTGGGLSASDYDHDGDLDLIVNSRGNTPVPRTDDIHHISGISTIYKNTLNTKTGKFTFEILPRSSPPIPGYIRFVCVSGWEDFDEDGYDDAVIGVCGDPWGIGDATYLWKNNYVENQMDHFIDVTQKYGLGKCNKELLESNGPQFPMSISYGHLDDDDNHFDLFTTNAGTPALYTMYKAIWDDENNVFLGYEAVDVEGFVYDQFSWGANFIDLDNDGKDDIITVGSFVAEFIGTTPNPGYVYRNRVNSAQNKYLFEQTQTLQLEWSSSVVANGDFDNDGYRDIVVNTVCDSYPLNSDCEAPVPLKIYRNNGGDLKRNDRYYLDVALKGNGDGTNYYGVGSIIDINIPDFKFSKRGKIRIGADGGNTNSNYAHFGIVNKNKMRLFKYGLNKNVKAQICVKWMGKEMTNECFNGIDLNQRIILVQGQGN